jgi:ADP-ribose pyrophosphatase YjhB (NUDIX family)
MPKTTAGTRTRKASSISETRNVAPMGVRVGVGAVILDGQGRVLLVKHQPSDSPRKHFWKGKWIGPGGMLEFGESLEEGAMREVREETGLEIDILRPLTPSDRLIFWKGKKYLQVVYIDFLAQSRGGTPRPGDDVAICQWFLQDGLEALGDELHGDTRELLERAGIMGRRQAGKTGPARP